MKRTITKFSPRLLRLVATCGSESSQILVKYETHLNSVGQHLSQDNILGTLRSCGLLLKGSRKALNLRALHEHRTRPLIIVGSGSSLNRLSQAERTVFDRCDVLTFNLSLMSDVRPKYHVFQPSLRRLRGSDNRERELDLQTRFAAEIISNERSRFAQTVLLSQTFSTWLTLSGAPSIFQKLSSDARPYSLPQIFLPAPYPLGLGRTCEVFKKEMLCWGDGGSTAIMKFGSTVPAMIALGIKLGYQRICLAGCDLLDETHFYDSEPYASRYDLRTRFPHWYEGREGSFFRQNLIDRLARGTSQDEDIVDLVNWLPTIGVSVRLINEDSVLSNRMKTVDASFFEG
jgi:hypothetical protein